MKNTMSYDEFIKWFEYYREEPFMADRLEYQMANLTYIVSSVMGGNNEWNQFLIRDIGDSSSSNEDQLEEKIKAIFGVKNG
ncbi:phage tail assembly protein T [Arcobacter sp.]|uniref:phage tail assembly protein T n=1 Tax=unclassified Arcobacter TaxID=2593671 RepID=UPI003B00DFB0